MRESGTVEEFIQAMGNLPTLLPGIAMRIIEVARREDPNLKKVSDILSMDPPLSAKIPKEVDFPLYRLVKPVISVHHAVTLLGVNVVKNLAPGFSIVRMHHTQRRCRRKRLQLHSILEKFPYQCNHFKTDDKTGRFRDGGRCFLGGLLHNIGTPALQKYRPDRYAMVSEKIRNSLCTCHEAIRQVFGFSHEETGEYLIRS